MDADDISEGHQRKRAERQLDDGIAAMLDQYSQLLLCARVRVPVQQGADELSASVASSALLQSADGLLSVAEGLTFEARRRLQPTPASHSRARAGAVCTGAALLRRRRR